jgi:hypothetical protein
LRLQNAIEIREMMCNSDEEIKVDIGGEWIVDVATLL